MTKPGQSKGHSRTESQMQSSCNVYLKMDEGCHQSFIETELQPFFSSSYCFSGGLSGWKEYIHFNAVVQKQTRFSVFNNAVKYAQ